MSENKDEFLDAMDVYRMARDLNIQDVKTLKKELAALGWTQERIDRACKTMAEMIVRHA